MATGLIGKTLGGRYEIRELLGEGGMAEVYAADHQRLGRKVAIKLMHRHLSTDPQFQARFEREAQAIARLKHPHIIQVYDYDYDEDLRQYYMVIEHIEGPSLSERMKKRDHPLTLGEAVRVIQDLADALGYAHAEGMQHRDIKPSNVMLDKGKRVVLTDFGIAKLLQEGAEHLTASGAMIGTPAYMSPEQTSGAPGDYRSDIYSLGIMFYQLVTGQLPYEGDSPVVIIMKHWQEVPKMPSEINPDVPPGVEAIILRCMAKDPNDRYESAQGLLHDLRDLDAAATQLDENRTLSTKLLTPQSLKTPTVSRTPATAATPAGTPITDTHITDTLATAPRQTTLLIGVGAVAIIVLMILGALLFSISDAGNQNPGNPCEITLREDLDVLTDPENSDFTLTFDEGDRVIFVAEKDGMYEIREDDESGWVETDELPLPEGCRLE